MLANTTSVHIHAYQKPCLGHPHSPKPTHPSASADWVGKRVHTACDRLGKKVREGGGGATAGKPPHCDNTVHSTAQTHIVHTIAIKTTAVLWQPSAICPQLQLKCNWLGRAQWLHPAAWVSINNITPHKCPARQLEHTLQLQQLALADPPPRLQPATRLR